MQRKSPISIITLIIFSILATASLYAHAEYYLVYSSPDFYDLCSNCQPPHHHGHHKKWRAHHTVRHHRRLAASRSGLYVYHPILIAGCPCSSLWTLNFCACCPEPNRVRSQWGDYVVFSSRPADRTYGVSEEDESSYNPDQSTADDGRADLEIN